MCPCIIKYNCPKHHCDILVLYDETDVCLKIAREKEKYELKQIICWDANTDKLPWNSSITFSPRQWSMVANFMFARLAALEKLKCAYRKNSAVYVKMFNSSIDKYRVRHK